MTTEVKAQVFENRLEALTACSERNQQFFVTTIAVGVDTEWKNKTFFVVAVSEHQAELALVRFVTPLTKWNKQRRTEAYIEDLEAYRAGVDAEKSNQKPPADESASDTMSQADLLSDCEDEAVATNA